LPVQGLLATERRWNRTIQAEGCSALPVLKIRPSRSRLSALCRKEPKAASAGAMVLRLPGAFWELREALNARACGFGVPGGRLEGRRKRPASGLRGFLPLRRISAVCSRNSPWVKTPDARDNIDELGKPLLFLSGAYPSFAVSGPPWGTVSRGYTAGDCCKCTIVAALVAAALFATAIQPQQASARTVEQAASLLRKRVAVLDARLGPRSFYVGARSPDDLILGSGWTRGFLPGALWQAGLRQAALRRTLANFGAERARTHDLGFMYELSSVQAYRTVCRARRGRRCRRLRRSGLAAAKGLMRVAASNRRAGTIPERLRRGGSSITIIDSVMNLSLLYWAGNRTGDRSYRRVAKRHLRRVQQLLVRPNGSTAQTVRLSRRGRVLEYPPRQGLAPWSTWSRGQAWALYGFTTSSAALRNRAMAAVAERLALWTQQHLPASGVPPWDYNAGPSAEPDTSAGVISAAGLFRLDALCRSRPSYCRHAHLWRPLAQRMLSGSLAHVQAPSGFFGGQVSGGGATPHEFSWGLYYALEAFNLSRRW
jgi:unsaturated chondroitin disaccharide hydrolase